MDVAIQARFRAVQQLQSLRSRHSPGSRRYEQIEHALDLALNCRRKVDDYLVRNLLRDARRVLDRQAAGRSYLCIADEARSTSTADDVGPSAVLTEANTPETLVAAEKLARRIVADVGTASSHAPRVFEGLLSGETHEETARAIGISSARVKQVRASLRAAAAKSMER